MADFTGSGSGDNTPSGWISVIRLLRVVKNQIVNNLSSAGVTVGTFGYLVLKAGVGTLSGTLSRTIVHVKSLTGEISLSGAYTRVINNLTRTYAGALSSAGSYSRLINKLTRTYAGVVSSSGAYSRLIGNLTRAYSGVLSSAGVILSYINTRTRTYSGTLSPSGAYTRLINNITRTYSSAVSFVGIAIGVAGEVVQAFYTNTKDGTLGLAGAITRIATIRRNVLNVSGYILSIRVMKVLTAVGSNLLSFAGDAAGVLYSKTALDVSIYASVSLSGLISWVYKTINRTYSGTVNFAGEAYNNTMGRSKTLAGIIAISGTILEVSITTVYTLIKSRAMSLTGSLTSRVPIRTRIKDGTLELLGYLTYSLGGGGVVVNYFRTYAGGLSFTGAVSRIYGWLNSKSGTLSFAGSYYRNIIITLAAKVGVLSFSGAYNWTYRAAGGVLDEARITLGTFFMTGVSSFMVPRGKAGALSMSGRLSYGEKTVEILYYGPPNL